MTLTTGGAHFALSGPSNDLGVVQVLQLLTKRREQRNSYRPLESQMVRLDILPRWCLPHFRSSYMRECQWDIPVRGKMHARCIRSLVLDEADANNISLVIFQEKSYALESACVTSPTTCT